jgi:hypothetical protein
LPSVPASRSASWQPSSAQKHPHTL